MTVTTKGDVAGDYGIYARNNANGTDLTVTTAAGSTVRGDSSAILASNRGSGALTVTANGYVSGDFDLGIIGGNEGTDLNLTTGVGSDISAVTTAISAGNSGTGALNVTVNGRVDSIYETGIAAFNSGTDLSVTTSAGSTVDGGYRGINARNYGTGALTITVNEDVTGDASDGILALSTGSLIAVTVGSTGSVTSTGVVPGAFAVEIEGGPGTLTVAGTLNGGPGGAVSFDQINALNDRFELDPGGTVNGVVLAGPATDTFALGGTGTASFDVGALGTQYQNFELFEKDGTSHWILTGSKSANVARLR